MEEESPSKESRKSKKTSRIIKTDRIATANKLWDSCWESNEPLDLSLETSCTTTELTDTDTPKHSQPLDRSTTTCLICHHDGRTVAADKVSPLPTLVASDYAKALGQLLLRQLNGADQLQFINELQESLYCSGCMGQVQEVAKIMFEFEELNRLLGQKRGMMIKQLQKAYAYDTQSKSDASTTTSTRDKVSVLRHKMIANLYAQGVINVHAAADDASSTRENEEPIMPKIPKTTKMKQKSPKRQFHRVRDLGKQLASPLKRQKKHLRCPAKDNLKPRLALKKFATPTPKPPSAELSAAYKAKLESRMTNATSPAATTTNVTPLKNSNNINTSDQEIAVAVDGQGEGGPEKCLVENEEIIWVLIPPEVETEYEEKGGEEVQFIQLNHDDDNEENCLGYYIINAGPAAAAAAAELQQQPDEQEYNNILFIEQPENEEVEIEDGYG